MITKPQRRRVLTGAAVLTIGLTLMGCSSGGGAAPSADSGDPELDALIVAAQEEGTVSFYTTADATIAEAAAEAFSEKYGVEATYTRLAQDELVQRFQSELDADAVVADVVLPFNDTWFYDQLDVGAFTPLSDEEIPGYPEGIVENAVFEGSAAFSTSLFGFEYNTDELSEGEAPTTWEVLLEPEFEGKILAAEPVSSIWRQWFYLVSEEYGIEYLEKLKGQIGRWYASVVPATEALAAGEGSVVIPGVPTLVLNSAAQGAPLAYITPDDVPYGSDQVVALTTKAPHPNAARLFAHFLYSEEGQAAYNSVEGVISPADAPDNSVRGNPDLAAKAEAAYPEIRDALGL
ncbi:ABC transporter substrate-binding protein [Microbacterium sp. LRZ72]|uniref:ABC transporter substrate-binding protein n=1 Tax=Microbacterium sp. LRZ72 TaxID=2942481 RepID=UPI0029B0CAC2|nr:ABC transporter substrate-binding protein [Microbacterium sp. LRZ72]MDX2377558.1 ABC transporter substrate-binding protein [Microbacterium sp. LRZ72]